MKLRDMKIGTRLGLAFSLLIFLIAVIAFTGWRSLVESRGQMDEIVNHNNRKTALANELIDNLNVVAQSTRNYLLHRDAEAHERERARLAEARKKYDAAFQALGRQLRTEEDNRLYNALSAHRDRVRPLSNQVYMLADEGKVEDAIAFLASSAQPALDSWFSDLYVLIDQETALTSAAFKRLDQNFDQETDLLAAVLAGSVVIGIFLAVCITRSITVPLAHAIDIAETVASGDLRSRITVTSADETGDLIRALQTMNDSLIRIVGEVQAGTGVIATAAAEIATGNQDLSARTEAQASSLEETATSMEELTSTVRQNAGNACQASDMALSAADDATQGGQVVSQVVHTMEAISESARRIVDIIGVIDGIAFQTNILALNAAVEAARAGEQGRGFAVVASEVRNLAQRAATASREIKSLIDDSVVKVASGTELAARAGATMASLVGNVQRVAGIMGEISVASQEQTAGIEQVTQAVLQMDAATQQSAAQVEEAAAAAAALQEQADKLSRLVAVFRIARTEKLQSSASPRLAAPAPRDEQALVENTWGTEGTREAASEYCEVP